MSDMGPFIEEIAQMLLAEIESLKAENERLRAFRSMVCTRLGIVETHGDEPILVVLAAIEHNRDELKAEVEQLRADRDTLRVLALSLRDAVNQYHATKSQAACDEVDRLARMANQPSLLDVPYVKSVINGAREDDSRTIKRLKAEIKQLRADQNERLPCPHCNGNLINGTCVKCGSVRIGG